MTRLLLIGRPASAAARIALVDDLLVDATHGMMPPVWNGLWDLSAILRNWGPP